MRTFSIVCAGLACLPLAAQDATNLPVIRSTTQEVLLDAVVRDKKERLIRNLKPEEIRVLEDGVPQKLQTFRFTDIDSDERRPRRRTRPAAAARQRPRAATRSTISTSSPSSSSAWDRAAGCSRSRPPPSSWPTNSAPIPTAASSAWTTA